MWSQIQVRKGPKRPLILIGKGWRKIFKLLEVEQTGYITAQDHALLQFVDEAADTLPLLAK